MTLDNVDGYVALREAVAALTRQVGTLQDSLGVLVGAQTTVRAEVDTHTVVLEQLDQTLTELAPMIARLAGSPGGPESVSSWTHCAVDQAKHADRIAAAHAWLEDTSGWLPARTPKAGRPVPACWPDHPGAREEILALHAAWIAAYSSDTPHDGMTAWHDRWVEPALTRAYTKYGLGRCLDRAHGEQALPGDRDHTPGRARAVIPPESPGHLPR